MRKKINKYSELITKDGDDIKKKLDSVSRQQAKFSRKDERQREYADKVHALKLNEVEGGLIAEASRTFHQLDLSSAYSNEGLKELKKHIEELERLHHSSKPETQSTINPRFEKIEDETESEHSLLPDKISNP